MNESRKNPIRKANNPKKAILIPLNSGFIEPLLAITVPATKRVDNDKPILSQAAVSIDKAPSIDKTNGKAEIRQENIGVIKTVIEDTHASLLRDSV